MLREAGFETLSATSGPEGRELAVAARPDLVILDIMRALEDEWINAHAGTGK